MKVAFVTTGASDDVQSWSGTPYFMSAAFIERGAELVRVQNLRGARSVLLRLRDIIRRKILRENYSTFRHKRRLVHYARQIAAQVEQIRPDIILSTSTLPIAYLETDIPIVFWTDATLAGLVDFYPEYVGLSRAALDEGNEAESAALRRCLVALYSSDWAARTAIENYDVDPAKVRVVNFGANIPAGSSHEEIASAVAKRPLNRCELLFAGKEWARKGGDIAIAVAVELNRRGLPTRLTLAGSAPPEGRPMPSCVDSFGFVDKNTPEGMEKLRRIFGAASFLMLPSRAECCAMVCAEANSEGVPVLASDVGGTSSAITHGVNGFLFPVGKLADEVNHYCDAVMTTLATPGEYRRLAMSSLQEYEKRLNWRVAAAKAAGIIENALTAAQTPHGTTGSL